MGWGRCGRKSLRSASGGSRNSGGALPGIHLHPCARHPGKFVGFLAISITALLVLCVGVAFADDPQIPAPDSPAANEQIAQAMWAEIEAGNPQASEATINAAQTDAAAAEELPHRELGRDEALELMQQVFGAELQNPAGIFDELEVERFLSNYAAIVPADTELASSGVVIGEGPSASGHATLLESTIPLRTPNDLGAEQPVDLGLEHIEGELQPANPLVEVTVPQELGEGIELPEAGVQIEVLGAPQERAPSTLDQSVAAYPNVAKDTSFAVAPTPTGVETMTLLQSADSPLSQTFRLDLPEGASLEATENGGAEVRSGEEPLLAVEPPSAIDAEGNDVPVSLQVEGDTLTLQASPGPEASYPILLDPVYDTFNWNGVTTTSGSWFATGFNNAPFSSSKAATCSNTAGAANQCGTPLTQGTPGLYISVNAGATAQTNAWTQMAYFVPRASSDYSTYGTLPSSFIESMTINHLGFWHRTDGAASPYLGAGIWAGPEPPGPNANPAGWTSFLSRGGNQADLNETLQYTFGGGGNHNAKEALVGMMAPEAHTMTAYRDSLFREVTISLGDTDKPGFGSITAPSGWMDQTAAPIGFTVSDAGLGVSSMTTTDHQNSQHSWMTSYGCAGTNDKPCPHTWKSTEAGHPALNYDPKQLPTGIDTLDVTATDALANVSTSAAVQVKVDHTAPSLSLSGTMTEQATLGTTRPRYILKANASDGTEAAPQSGVASVKVSVDGKQVQLTQPGCSTKNCQLATEWTLNSASYSVGYHFVTVTATDAVGRSATKELLIQIQRDTTKPTFSLAGELQEAPDSWVNQRNYTFNVSSSDGGYGVSKVQLLIDGKVPPGGTSEQSCVEGACPLSKTFTINMANYSGGEHTGTVVVTDGAGNKAEISNPFRVNPSGAITNAEAAATLEAVEETTEQQPVASTPELIDYEERLAGDDPQLEQVGSLITSSGVPDTTTLGPNASEGFLIEGNDGPLRVTPGGGNGGSEIVEDVAAVTSDVGAGIDTVIRPEFNGALVFQAIREASSPEAFSWNVQLTGGQKLRADNPQQAEVDYEDGTEAFLVTAEAAHDATGKAVSTHLEVSGSTLTLVVEHRQQGVVYPVTAGQAYETSYTAPVAGPAPEAKEEREARERAEEEERLRLEEEMLAIEAAGGPFTLAQAEKMIRPSRIGMKVPAPPQESGEASTSKIRTFELDVHHCAAGGCDAWKAEIYGGGFVRGRNYVNWSNVPFHCKTTTGKYPFIDTHVEIVGYVGPGAVYKGEGRHLTAWCHFTVSVQPIPEIGTVSKTFSLQDWVFPNGYQEGYSKEIEDGGVIEN